MRVFLVQYLGLHPEDGKNVRREEMVGFADVDEIVGRANSDLVSAFARFGWDGVLSVFRCSRYYSCLLLGNDIALMHMYAPIGVVRGCVRM